MLDLSCTVLLNVLHLFAFATWFGMLLWVSFVAGIIMFKNMPKQQFGEIQSHLFPWYFRIGAACAATLVGITALKTTTTTTSSDVEGCWGSHHIQLYSLIAGLLLTLANMFWVGPKTTAVMRLKTKLEKEIGDSTAAGTQLRHANKQFKILHGVSSLVNLLVIFTALFHVIYLAQRLSF